MPGYNWTCHVCRTPNSKEETHCIQCSCPAKASGIEIQQRLKAYTGPIHESAVDTPLADGTQAQTGKQAYCCSKCGHNRCRVGNIRTSGSFLSAVFEVESERFCYIACGRCRYTEFYQCDSSALGQMFDFLVG